VESKKDRAREEREVSPWMGWQIAVRFLVLFPTVDGNGRSGVGGDKLKCGGAVSCLMRCGGRAVWVSVYNGVRNLLWGPS
jgi:hypothetical protein